MKKYLFVSPTHYESSKLTGAHKRFMELAYSFAETENVTVLSHSFPKRENVDINILELDELKLRGIPKHIIGILEILSYLKKNTVECDYAISFFYTVTFCLYKCGYKRIITFFREDIIGYLKCLGASKFKLMYWAFFERYAVKKSKYVFVQCTNDKDALINRTKEYIPNVEKKTIVQINNANSSWMKSIESSHYVDKSSPKILFIGNFSDERKGHNFLLPAIKRLINDGYVFSLTILGEGYQINEFKELFKENDNVHFVGFVTDICKYLKECNVLLVPSIIDSCPNTVLEGLSYGLAVYGSNRGGIPDLLVDDSYMFEPQVEEIYKFLSEKIKGNQYIKDAINQKILLEKLSFDWGEMIKDKIYELENL